MPPLPHILRSLLLACTAICSLVVTARGQDRGFNRVSQGIRDNSLAYGAKYALLIGINDYEPGSGFLPLRYAENDALELYRVLVNKMGFPPGHVKMLLGREATRRNIQNALESFQKDNIPENSQLLFFFAGHGTTTGINGARKRGFLVPVDGRDGELNATSLAMDELRQQAEFLRPKHVLFLVDACYGGLAQSRNAIPSIAFLRNVWEQRCREIITAGSAEETVLETSEWRHSAFTKVLLDALDKGQADTNGDDVIVTNELFGYIQQRVPYYAQQKGGRQTPQLSSLVPETGTFLFELSKGALLKSQDQSFIQDVSEISSKLNSTLHIRANVASAKVRIDDREAGSLKDSLFSYSLAPGYYKVEITKEKYEPALQEIEIGPDTTTVLRFDLKQKEFTIHVSPTPADALVWVDQRLTGAGSQVLELEKGRYFISVQKTGYLDENQILDVVENSDLAVTLKKIKANVEIRSNPFGASVTENGTILGITPARFELDFGAHELLVHKEDFLPQTIKVEVREPLRITQEIALEMDPNGSLMRKKTLNKLNRSFLGSVGLSTLGLLSGLYFDSRIRENLRNTTFLTMNDDRVKRGHLQTAKHVSLLFCGFELVSSVIKLRTVARFRSGKPVPIAIRASGNAESPGLSMSYILK